MVLDLASTFDRNVRTMKFLGMWFPKKYKRLYQLFSALGFVFFTSLVPILSCVYLAKNTYLELLTMSQTLFMTIQLLTTIFKFISIIWKFKGVGCSFVYLRSEVFVNLRPQQEEILRKSVTLVKRIYKVFLASVLTCLFTWAVIPIITWEYKLPISVWLPFDGMDTWAKYVTTYIYLFVGTGYGALTHCMLDTLSVGLMVIAIGQIRALKESLSKLTVHTDEEMRGQQLTLTEINKKRAEILYSEIRECVIHHEAIIGFVENIQDTYSIVMFSQFIASALVICICAFVLTMIPVNSYEFFQMLVFLLTILGEIYLFCYFGTDLYKESSTITDAIYLNDWYNFDQRSKKALIILMERTKRPILLTAGSVLNISLDTWTMILRRAYSLLAVLQNYK